MVLGLSARGPVRSPLDAYTSKWLWRICRLRFARAIAAGAHAETEIKTTTWGKIVAIADPFGQGICLIEFPGRGYDEIPEPAASG